MTSDRRSRCPSSVSSVVSIILSFSWTSSVSANTLNSCWTRARSLFRLLADLNCETSRSDFGEPSVRATPASRMENFDFIGSNFEMRWGVKSMTFGAFVNVAACQVRGVVRDRRESASNSHVATARFRLPSWRNRVPECWFIVAT